MSNFLRTFSKAKRGAYLSRQRFLLVLSRAPAVDAATIVRGALRNYARMNRAPSSARCVCMAGSLRCSRPDSYDSGFGALRIPRTPRICGQSASARLKALREPPIQNEPRAGSWRSVCSTSKRPNVQADRPTARRYTSIFMRLDVLHWLLPRLGVPT